MPGRMLGNQLPEGWPRPIPTVDPPSAAGQQLEMASLVFLAGLWQRGQKHPWGCWATEFY